jgi:pre-mRNA-splicing factor ATP-dependent RNA helicase DHX15/PRP43
MESIIKNIDDILDSKAKNNNFINDKPFSAEYKKLAKNWSKLPLYVDKDKTKQFFELLRDKQVILLISGTGSGKTVLVPKYFLKYVKSMGMGGKVAITNPKVITTISNAEYGAKTLDVNIGDEVGYRFKGSPSTSYSQKTKLVYLTDGLLLATMFSGDNILSEYQGIIIDEAHERHVQIDLLLRLIKDILPLRPDFKLIIMSATINASVFKEYFDDSSIKYGELDVSGESYFPINENWLDKTTKITKSNYMDLAIERCLNIIESSDQGDIIVFVPTQKDTLNGCKLINERCPSNLKLKSKQCDKLYCVEVYSKMKIENKELAVEKDLYKKKGFSRKIIFATNVAESSITFDGLIYVIDSGLEMGSYYNVDDNSYVITKLYTSKSQIKQRIGRVGRTQHGIAYHLYNQQMYNNFKQYPEPNISVVDLTDFMLLLVNYVKTIKNMIPITSGLITVPKIEQIVYTIYKLHFNKLLKLVDKSDALLNINDIPWLTITSFDQMIDIFNGSLSTIGLNVLKFKSSPLLSALAIITSKFMNCQPEIIKMMGIIEISDGKLDSIFEYDRKDTDKIMKYFKVSSKNNSDHLTVLSIYNDHYLKNDFKYLNKKSFENIEKRINQLNVYANSITSDTYTHMKDKYELINSQPYEDEAKNILYVLLISHYYNLLKKETNNQYTSLNFLKNTTAPVEYFMLTPPTKSYSNFVICHSLINMFENKFYQCVTQIPDDIINDFTNKEQISKNKNKNLLL